MGANILYIRVGDGAVRRKFCWTRRRSEGDRWSGGEGGIVHARFPANRPSVRPYVSTQARTARIIIRFAAARTALSRGAEKQQGG